MIPRATLSAIAVLLLGFLCLFDSAGAHSDAAPLGSWSSQTSHHYSSSHASPSHRNGHLFPFLTWLRDSTIELVFGRPTSSRRKPALASGPDNSNRRSYADDVVIRFNVTTREEEEALSEAADRLFLDVWAFTREYVDIRIHKESISSLRSLLPESLLTAYAVLIPDLDAAVWASYPSSSVAADELKSWDDGIDNVFFRDYQPMPVISRWMQLLEAMFPSFVNVTSIGKSYEGRDIPALRVGRVDGLSTAPRKTILVTGGLHAREWISTTTVNYLAWSFITAYGKEPLITKLLNNFDIVFVPAVNPDGVEYTWQSDRLWRKSRQHTNLRFCRGLDLDHAFGYEWDSASRQHGAGGQSNSDPCSESYGGDQPFQAVEAYQLAQWARNETFNGVRFVGYLDLHSYSQQVLFPFSYTCDIDPPNRENLEELAAGLAKSIRLSSGEVYGIASACEGAVVQDLSLDENAGQPLPRIESGGGSAIDWFYHELQARYSYQIKLRDTGSYGFLLPKEHIVPTGKEMFNAMKYFGDFLLGNNGIERLRTSSPMFPGEEDKAQKALLAQNGAGEVEDEEWLELRRRRRRR